MADIKNNSCMMEVGKGFDDTSSIKAIDKRSVHQICSGQVILSLATAVKELVENSIDAGATNVEIRLREFGMDSIEVHDNGSGIEEKDFDAIGLKHCTSKLTDFSDLTMIDTFGFRGEALSSLCALSNLAVVTRHHSKAFGCRLEFDYDGKLSSRTPCARELGTTVLVSQLFHTLPVRHKEFQRNIKKEFPKLSSVLQAYGIISTGVRLSCINVADKNRKTVVVSTHGSDSCLDNIASIFGPKQVQQLLRFTQKEPTDEVLESFNISGKSTDDKKHFFTVDGYISRVDHGSGRASPDRQFYFINKRPCDIPKVARVVNEVYRMYNRHQNPFVFLNISLNSELVDVNITPDKRQIFVQNEKLLLATLKTSLLYMFTETAGQYQVNAKIPEISAVISSSPGSSNQTSSLDLTVLSEPSSKRDHKDGELPFSNPPNKQAKSLVADSVNRGLSISSVLTNLRGRFSRSPCKSPSTKSSQISIDKFTHAIRKEISEVEIDRKARELNSIGKELTDFAQEKKCPVSPVSVVDRSCLSNSPSSLTQVHPGHEGSLNSTSKTENAKLVWKEASGRALPASRSNQQDYVPLNGHKEHTLSETSDTQIVNEGKQCYTQCQDKSVVTCSPCSGDQQLSKEAVGDSEVHPDSNPSETLPCKQDESVVTISDDLGSSSGAEKPCKRLRFSRPEVRVPFDISKLRYDLKLHSSHDIHGEEPWLGFHAKISPNQNVAAEEELRKNITKEMFKEMEIIGQFNLGFIITKIHDDLFIIDQHATDEKYNFETLQKEHCLKGQKLIQPRPLELTPTNESILIDNMDIFRKNGFDFSTNETLPSGNRVKLISLPTSRNWTFGVPDIEELLFMLSDSPGVMCRPSRVRSMFASRACRMSTMVGTALNHSQMKTLVSHMAQIEHPWNCPHGRPTMRHLVNLRRINKKIDSQCQSEK